MVNVLSLQTWHAKPSSLKNYLYKYIVRGHFSFLSQIKGGVEFHI